MSLGLQIAAGFACVFLTWFFVAGAFAIADFSRARPVDTSRAVLTVRPMKKNSPVFIRTVTNFYTGRVVSLTKSWIVLEDVSWIADTGRFSTFLERGVPNEAERMPGRVHVSRASIVDVSEWRHALPVATK